MASRRGLALVGLALLVTGASSLALARRKQASMVGRSVRIEGVLVPDQTPLTGDAQFEANQDKCKAINRCSQHGVCVDGGTFGFACECLFGWGGEDCGTGLCANNCSGTGVCNTETARCDCDFGFGSVNCSKYLRDDICPNECSGHGTCEPMGQCACFLNWGSVDCSHELCPGNCSGHGSCNTMVDPSFGNGAQCMCEPGWKGHQCEKEKKFCAVINGKVCAGNGRCDENTKTKEGRCQCNAGWQGEHCDMVECELGYMNHARTAPPYGFCPNDCSCRGHCVCNDANNSDAKCYCACMPGYGGQACELKISLDVPFEGVKVPYPDVEVYNHLHPYLSDIDRNTAIAAGRTIDPTKLKEYEAWSDSVSPGKVLHARAAAAAAAAAAN